MADKEVNQGQEEEALPKYTWQEIEKHNSIQSLWVVIHDLVYDITEFAEEHPGGEEVLLELAGKDATDSFEDVGHSSDAKDMQKKYVIGVLAEPSKKEKDKAANATSEPEAGYGASLFPVVLVILAIVAYYIYRNYL